MHVAPVTGKRRHTTGRLSFDPVIFKLVDGNMVLPSTPTRGSRIIRDDSTVLAYLGTLETAARNAHNCRIESINPFGADSLDVFGLRGCAGRHIHRGQFDPHVVMKFAGIPEHLQHWYPNA